MIGDCLSEHNEGQTCSFYTLWKCEITGLFLSLNAVLKYLGFVFLRNK